MKKNIIILLITVSILTVFSSCDLMNSIFGSDEAAITTFTEARVVGEPVIDVENKRITLTVEPIDLASFNPVITISEGAVISAPESIADGVAAIYKVTAENGDIVEWKVTVNIQYGISFTIDGTKTVYTCGFIDNTDAVSNTNMGDGAPGIEKDIDNTSMSYLFFKEQDINEPPEYDYLYLELSGITVGKYEDDFFAVTEGAEGDLEEKEYVTDYNVTEFGDTGGAFRATFSGEAEDGTKLTNGFAKLQVIEHY